MEVLDQPEMCLGYDDPLLAVRPRERLGEPPHVGAPSRVYGHYQRYVAGRWIRAFGDGGEQALKRTRPIVGEDDDGGVH